MAKSKLGQVADRLNTLIDRFETVVLKLGLSIPAEIAVEDKRLSWHKESGRWGLYVMDSKGGQYTLRTQSIQFRSTAIALFPELIKLLEERLVEKERELIALAERTEQYVDELEHSCDEDEGESESRAVVRKLAVCAD